MIIDRAIEPLALVPAAPPRRLVGLTVADAGRLLWRGRLVVVLCALAGAVAAGFVGKALPPRYTATAQLYIDPRDLRIVDRELNPQNGDSNAAIAQIESEARVLTGTNVLRRVVESEHLAGDPDYQERPSLLARLGLGGAVPEPAADGAPSSGPVMALARALSVRRVERTFIVDVTAQASTAERAARLANAISAAYLAEVGETRSDAARRATDSLKARLSELGERVRAAETRVEEYKARYRLVGSRGQLVTEQQLTDVNTQLTAARGRAADAQARYDQIQEARGRVYDAGSLPEAVASQTIGALRGQYAQLRARQAELRDLGPRHPALLNQAAQVADVQRLIGEEIGRLTQAARNDLDRAKSLESAVAARLDGLKRQTIEDGGASVQLRELERDVEASRAVYQSFLNRSREIGEQERLDTANARVITVALPPTARSFPPRVSLLVALGGAGGLALGAYLALAPALLVGMGGAPSRLPSPRADPAPTPAVEPDPATVRVGAGAAGRLPVIAALDETVARLRPARRGRTVALAEIGLPALEPAFRPAFAEAVRAALGPAPAGRAPRIAVIGPDAAARSAVAANLALALAPCLLVDADHAGRGLSRAAARTLRAPAAQAGGRDEDAFRLTDEGAVLLEAPARAAPGSPSQAALARAFAEARPDLAAVILDGPSSPGGRSGAAAADPIADHPVDHVILAATPADLGAGLKAWLRRERPAAAVAGIVVVTLPGMTHPALTQPASARPEPFRA